MGGRRRLKGGYGVWLDSHRSPEGVLYRRYLRADEEAVGGSNGSALVRFAVERYARAGVLYDAATRHWADLLRLRQTGTGRRPSEQRVERAARRAGLADGTLKDALAQLVDVAARRKPPPSPILSSRSTPRPTNKEAPRAQPPLRSILSPSLRPQDWILMGPWHRSHTIRAQRPTTS
jgi:hypothetical protein